jgi:amino acid adenylation domain-containing protein/thioester reductase-like protein
MLNGQSYTSIHQLIERQVAQNPNAIAVTFQERRLTYQELNQKANQVAHHLQSLGVTQETLVGVCIERSPEMLIALLAVLKAGGAYVPLDPSYPPERLAFMMEDSELPILLTEQAQLDKLPQHSAQAVVLETDWTAIAQHSLENLESDVTPDHLAYTIYTSGSTGKPKGVQVLHGGVINFLASMGQEPGLSQADTLLAVTTISFDIAVLELFLPLTIGAHIVLVSRDVASDGVRLAQVMAESSTTFMQATPATWRLLLATGWQGDRQLKILCGGEAMPRSLADQLLERCASLWNMYGPTETTVWSAVCEVKSGEGSVPIGYPIANTQIYLIDEQFRRQNDPLTQSPIGQPGEVYIGGDGLARGYLNRLEMTQERFIPDPFSATPGARLYRTGDLARLLPDGRIQFIGRVDHQVKIRGYRIELGDIEAALSQYPEIKEAAVITREDTVGEKRLVAYVASKGISSLDLVPHLRIFLKEKLPEYMVPSAFVLMDALPLTPNGKIDRRALPAPSQERPTLGELFVAPRHETEQQLAHIWGQILDIQPIGIYDNFFDLGGHSLLVAQMIAQVAEMFQVELPLSCLFENPSIAGLAQAIASAQQPDALLSDRHQPDLLADAMLDPSIFPENAGVDWANAPQNILLTGATGFLGAFLLDELLQSTQANIYCLIRCSSLEVGQQKLRRNLTRYALNAAAQSSRVIPVLGDLSRPLLGLDPEQFRQLAGQIDLIYHNGAFVNLIYPYAALRDTNVLGTQEVLRLASQVKVKPVHFISTLDVFQSAHHAQMDTLLEQDDFPAGIEPGSGYAKSKWVAEKLVKAAHERGIPTCISRPGMIIGHSQTGYSNTQDLVGRFIKGLIQLESAPQMSLDMHLTPVDYVSQAIVSLSNQQESWGKAFHLTNAKALSLVQLVQHIQSLGYAIQYTEYDQWQTKLLGLDMSEDNALSPLMSLFTTKSEFYSSYLEVLTLEKVSCQNVIAGLEKTSIRCPVLDTNLLNTYFSYFIQSGFLHRSQPQPDQAEAVLIAIA